MARVSVKSKLNVTPSPVKMPCMDKCDRCHNDDAPGIVTTIAFEQHEGSQFRTHAKLCNTCFGKLTKGMIDFLWPTLEFSDQQ